MNMDREKKNDTIESSIDYLPALFSGISPTDRKIYINACSAIPRINICWLHPDNYQKKKRTFIQINCLH